MSPMQNRLMVPQRTPLLLDLAPGAAAAFSLRQLSNSYIGPVVTVRRSTDSAEADFTANEIDNGDLASWCMGGDGFAKQWWDQSGNARHASNSTAAQQPKVCSAGVVILEGGKPAVQFDGTDDRLITASIQWSTAISFAASFKGNYNSAYHKLISIGADNQTTGYSFAPYTQVAYQDWQAADAIVFGSGWLSSEYPRIISNGRIFSDNTPAIAFVVMSSSASSMHVNGAEISYRVRQSGATDASSLPLYIGGKEVTGQNLLGTISELLIYPRDMTAERQLVEGNMAWYF